MDTQKKNTFLLAALVLLALGVLLLIAQDREITVSNAQENTISVTGEAEQFIAPDTASISFSMTRKSKNLSEATDSVNKRISELIRSLKDDGVKESDIKTTGYNVNPQYVYLERERTFDGYRVTQSVQVKIRDLDNVNTVVTKIGKLEVDNVSGLTFFIDNDEKIQEDLREDAIKDAKKKASKLAKDLGVNLDDIVGFSEGGGGYYPNLYSKNGSFALESADFAPAPASIPAGENRLQSTVTITYTIK